MNINMNEFVKEYYSATLAHEQSQKNLENKIKKSIAEIFNKYINRAIDNGKFYVEIPDTLIDENVKVFLSNLGYNIKIQSTGRNETYYQILW